MLSSNTRQNLRQMEAHLLQSEIKEIVTPLSRYHFQEPVLYDFIHSDCDDFEEYVQAISEPEDEDHEESAEDLYDFPIDDFHIPINPYEPGGVSAVLRSSFRARPARCLTPHALSACAASYP